MTDLSEVDFQAILQYAEHFWAKHVTCHGQTDEHSIRVRRNCIIHAMLECGINDEPPEVVNAVEQFMKDRPVHKIAPR